MRFSRRQMIELDACTRCGECFKWCCVSAEDNSTVPHERINTLRTFFKRRYGLRAKIFGAGELLEEEVRKYSSNVYNCTLCGRCRVVCPVRIDLRNLWISMREGVVDDKNHPDQMELAKDSIEKQHNVLNYPNGERVAWLEYMDKPPEHVCLKEKAEVVYFVGCIASFSPAVQSIPESFVRILDKAGVDFILMGGEEWCCGFPLIGAGMKDEIEGLKEHNIERVRKTGAKTIVFTCPSCYNTWINEYEIDIEKLHSTEFIKRLVDEGEIALKEIRGKVTYHDPCDLGRNSGVFEAPRAIIKAIPGLNFREMEKNREKASCCGGGGDFEMIDGDLAGDIAETLIDEAIETEADRVVTACQQCVRMMAKAIKRKGSKIEVLDITELIMEAMD